MPQLWIYHQHDSAKFSERPVCPYCDGSLIGATMTTLPYCRTRLAEFKTKTQPLAGYYGKMSILHHIDGNRDRDAVFADISQLIETKEAA